MTAKWKVLSSRTIVKDRWVHLSADICATPSGVELEPYYVLHSRDFVMIVALNERDEVALVREYRHGIGEVCLGLPSGVIDADDVTAETAARRELAEEAGFAAAEWRAVARLQVDPARYDNHLHVFLARGLTPLPDRRLDAGEEGMEVELWPAQKLLDGLAQGSLAFADHVAALLLALGAAGRLDLRRPPGR